MGGKLRSLDIVFYAIIGYAIWFTLTLVVGALVVIKHIDDAGYLDEHQRYKIWEIAFNIHKDAMGVSAYIAFGIMLFVIVFEKGAYMASQAGKRGI